MIFKNPHINIKHLSPRPSVHPKPKNLVHPLRTLLYWMFQKYKSPKVHLACEREKKGMNESHLSKFPEIIIECEQWSNPLNENVPTCGYIH